MYQKAKDIENNQMCSHGPSMLCSLKFCHSEITTGIPNSASEAKTIITLLNTNQDSFCKKSSCIVRLQSIGFYILRLKHNTSKINKLTNKVIIRYLITILGWQCYIGSWREISTVNLPPTLPPKTSCDIS